MLRGSTFLLFACFVVATISAQKIGLREDRGGWRPPPPLCARAATLGGLEPRELAAAVQQFEAEGGAALRTGVCRAGLRLADAKAALACATRLEWQELDNWEIERVIALCLAENEYARPGTLVDFEKLRSMIGGKELPRMFENFPIGPCDQRPTYYLANLHRQCTAEHIPVLAALGTRPEAEIRANAWDNLRLVATRTDRHRDTALRASLTRKSVLITTGPERALAPDEWTAALRTIVFRQWPEEEGRPDPVVRRAVLSLKPWPEIEPMLRQRIEPALAKNAGPAALSDRQVLLLRAMRHFRTAETRDLLRRAAATDRLDAGHDCSPQLVALAALAAHGDADARAALARRAVNEDEALALWFEAEPRAAVTWFRGRLLGGSDADAEAALARWHGVAEVRHSLVLCWPDDLFEGLDGKAAVSPRGGLALLGIAGTIPGCATDTLVRVAVSRLQAREVRSALDRDAEGALVLSRLALAEAAAPTALREKLRLWAKGPDAVVRRAALRALLVMGDPTSGPLLAAWVGGNRERDPHLQDLDGWRDGGIPALLARSPCAEVRAWLRERAGASLSGEDQPARDLFTGLGILEGWPPATAGCMARKLPVETDETYRGRLRRLLAGRGDEALRAWLRAAHRVPSDLWRLDRPEVHVFLRRLQREREHGQYARATAALACRGDTEARNETLAAFRAGRYRWIDEVAEEPAYATLGYDFTGMVPFWIEQLESNCCRNVVAESVFNELFAAGGELFLDSIADGWETRASIVQRWWCRHRHARFTRSRLARRFIPILPY